MHMFPRHLDLKITKPGHCLWCTTSVAEHGGAAVTWRKESLARKKVASSSRSGDARVGKPRRAASASRPPSVSSTPYRAPQSCRACDTHVQQ